MAVGATTQRAPAFQRSTRCRVVVSVEPRREMRRMGLGQVERSVPKLKALQEAAASDEAAQARLTQYDEDRRNVMVVGLAFILDRW
jgi:hypothetical protein